MLKREKISDGIYLNYVEDKRFKVNTVNIRFLLPIQTEKNSSRALIFPVITRGTVNYPTKTAPLLFKAKLSVSSNNL